MSIRFTAKSRFCSFDIELQNKITIIQGYSGAGRTSLFKCINSFIDDDKNISGLSDLPIIPLTRASFSGSFDIFRDDNIYIFDENSHFLRKNDLCHLIDAVTQYNSYFIIMSRNYYIAQTLGATVTHLESHKEGDLQVYHLVYDNSQRRYYE